MTSPFVTPAEPGDQTSELMRAILAVPEWRDMYFRRLRTVVNQVLAPGRLEALYDAKVGPAQPESTLDLARWPRQNGSATYAGLRTHCSTPSRPGGTRSPMTRGCRATSPPRRTS